MLLTLITKSTNTSHSPKIHIPFSKMCFQDLQDLNPNLFKFCLLSVLTKYSTLYCLGKENILLFPKYAIFFLPYSWLSLFWSILFVNSACTQPLNHVWLCDPMEWSKTGFLVFHYLLEFAQIHVYWVDIIFCHLILCLPLLLLPSIFPTIRVSSSHQLAKASKLRLQHQSFQWILRVDFL